MDPNDKNKSFGKNDDHPFHINFLVAALLQRIPNNFLGISVGILPTIFQTNLSLSSMESPLRRLAKRPSPKGPAQGGTWHGDRMARGGTWWDVSIYHMIGFGYMVTDRIMEKKKPFNLDRAAPASDFSIIAFFPIRVQNIPEVIRTFFFSIILGGGHYFHNWFFPVKSGG